VEIMTAKQLWNDAKWGLLLFLVGCWVGVKWQDQRTAKELQPVVEEMHGIAEFNTQNFKPYINDNRMLVYPDGHYVYLPAKSSQLTFWELHPCNLNPNKIIEGYPMCFTDDVTAAVRAMRTPGPHTVLP
jgi:hypothetical protein